MATGAPKTGPAGLKALVSLVPYGLNQQHPNNYKHILNSFWQNQLPRNTQTGDQPPKESRLIVRAERRKGQRQSRLWLSPQNEDPAGCRCRECRFDRRLH